MKKLPIFTPIKFIGGDCFEIENFWRTFYPRPVENYSVPGAKK